MRVLLIEDDSLIGDGIKIGLSKLGFSIDWFTKGQEGAWALDSTPYDIVILDLTLPDMDGLNILHQWRTSGHTVPVLVLTARNTLDQKIEGLDKGADDYLAKPFALEELAARLRALVRRNHQVATPSLTHGSITLNPATREVHKGEESIHMSPKEVLLVEAFLLNKDKTLTKTQIEEKLYTWDEEVSSNTIEFHIHQIRKKLGSNFIKTIRGIGYILGDI